MPAVFKKLEDNYKLLTECQKTTFDYIVKNELLQKLIWITGGGGVGKSFLIEHIYQYLTNMGFVCQKTATSGQAAKLINGITTHGFFGLNYDLKIFLQYEDLRWQKIKNTDFIIIDEISLLNGEILKIINEILQSIHDNKELFGGVSIILIGDLLQLPAVTTLLKPVTQLKDTSLFLENFLPFILETNMRQVDDVRFADLLSRCRLGELNEDDHEFLQKRFLIINVFSIFTTVYSVP